MNWVKLYTAYYLDPAVADLSPDAEIMFVRGLAYCGMQETGGEIKAAVCPTLCRRAQWRRVAAELVSAGLWAEIDAKSARFIVKNWSKWQRTLDDLAHDRKAGRERVSKHRERKRKAAASKNVHTTSSGNGVTPPATPGAGNGVTDADVTPLVTHTEVEVEVELPTPNGVGARPTSTALVTTDDAPTAQTLVGEWIDHCQRRPPAQVIGQVSKHIKALLAEGIAYADVRAGLARWAGKGLHPSTLPSVVNEVMNARPGAAAPKQSTTDARVQQAIDLAARYRAQEATTTTAAVAGS